MITHADTPLVEVNYKLGRLERHATHNVFNNHIYSKHFNHYNYFYYLNCFYNFNHFSYLDYSNYFDDFYGFYHSDYFDYSIYSKRRLLLEIATQNLLLFFIFRPQKPIC